jgi:hypothetical protein
VSLRSGMQKATFSNKDEAEEWLDRPIENRISA